MAQETWNDNATFGRRDCEPDWIQEDADGNIVADSNYPNGFPEGDEGCDNCGDEDCEGCDD